MDIFSVAMPFLDCNLDNIKVSHGLENLLSTVHATLQQHQHSKPALHELYTTHHELYTTALCPGYGTTLNQKTRQA